MIQVKTLILGPFDVNCYVVSDELSKECMIIDPADFSPQLEMELEGLELKYIVNTHGHFDHIGGNTRLKSNYKDVPIIIHRDEAKKLNNPELNLSTLFTNPVISVYADLLLENESFEPSLGKNNFKIMILPGHSEGGIALYQPENKLLFSGDLIFSHSVGRTDMPGGNTDAMKQSIDRLLSLPDTVKVYPGHESPFLLGNFRKLYNQPLFFES